LTANPNLSIIIPTFNEAANIGRMIESILSILKSNGIHGEVLVVDDSSRDGTIQLVQDIAASNPAVRIIVREDDPGLSQSVVEGFSAAQGDILLVIDADFSHPPSMIPEMYNAVFSGADIVVGSRYLKGGGIEDWPLKRRIISLGATGLARILVPEVTDPVSGFFALKRSVVSDAPLRPRGYKILLEVLGRGEWATVTELPFTFHDREAGESKLRMSTMIEYAAQVLSIAFSAPISRTGHVYSEWMRLIKFGLVGLSGIVVNMGLLYLLTEYAGVYYLVSAVVAIEVSILNNFILNDFWTFSSRRLIHRYSWIKRLFAFHIIAAGGLLINLGVLYLLVEFAGIYYMIANLTGILVAFLWNFFLNRHLTWKGGVPRLN